MSQQVVHIAITAMETVNFNYIRDNSRYANEENSASTKRIHHHLHKKPDTACHNAR
jgi:hypothetical protein